MAESSRGPRDPLRATPAEATALEAAIAAARDALVPQPAGILTDFDGTLSPIVAEPALARLVDGAAGALGRLVDRLAVVAIVTGRAPLEARALVATPRVLVAGNHGTEWLEPDAAAPVPSRHAERIRPLLEGVAARVPELEGVAIEDKGLSMTVHVRTAPDPDRAERLVRERIGAVPDGIEVRSGRRSLELRPTGIGDKGVAARAIIERFRLRGVVVLGDDVTDLDMFRAVAEERAAGRLRGAIIGVGGDDREVPAEVVASADVVVTTPADAARLLEALAAEDPAVAGSG